MKKLLKIIWILVKICFQAIVLLFAFIGLATVNACENEYDQKTLANFINDHAAGKRVRLSYEVRDS